MCNTHCKRFWSTKNNIHLSKTTNVDKYTCADWQLLDISNMIWIMKGKIVVFRSNLNHSFVNRCLTLILLEEEIILPKRWTATSAHISGCLFCFVLFLVSHFFLYLTFLFFLFLLYITRNVSEQLLCQLIKQNWLVMMRESIHLSLRSARLDRLLDPPTLIHCS